MTPERAAYHRLTLLAGFREEFEQEVDHALETEDPITAPILDLAFCLSDPNQTISILYNYILDCPVDQQQVYDMIMAELRRQFVTRQLTATQVCEALSVIQRTCGLEEPWFELYRYLYEYELLLDGIISREVFEAAFEAVFLRGEQLNVFQMEKASQQIKKKSILDFFRKHKGKEKPR